MKPIFEATRFVSLKNSEFPEDLFRHEMIELITDIDEAVDIGTVKDVLKVTIKVEIADERKP